jgi:lipopolysaccharide export system permease protein
MWGSLTTVRILSLYILRQLLVPFLLGFGVVTFILEMDVLFDYLDLVVNRGVAVATVAHLFVLSLGYIVALSVPCAVLVAVLMTFGRLSQDNEITALKASGVNLGRVLLMPLAAAGVLAWGLTLFNNHVLPEANHSFANLLSDILRMRPTVKLQEGVFITDFPGYNMLVQSVNGRTNEMRGVTIYQFNAGQPPTTILADKGFLTYTPDGKTAVLDLSDGEIHEIPKDEPGAHRYRRLVFRKHTLYIHNAGAVLERTVRESRSDREMSARHLLDERQRIEREYADALAGHRARVVQEGIPAEAFDRALREPTGFGMLAAAITRLRGEDAMIDLMADHPDQATQLELIHLQREEQRKRIAGLTVEIHKKFSLPVACVVFVLIGAPIGMRVRRAGPAVAFVSILFFLFYYLCLIGGEELANRLLLPAWLAMWLPNLVLGAWGVRSTLRACELRWRRAPRRPVAVPA